MAQRQEEEEAQQVERERRERADVPTLFGPPSPSQVSATLPGGRQLVHLLYDLNPYFTPVVLWETDSVFDK